VEEQIAANSAKKAGTMHPERQGPAPNQETPVEGKKPGESPQAGGTPSDDPPDEEETREEVTQKVKHKKINSRKKLGKQTRTIVVTVPKEKEGIKDIEKAKQGKGRPRKVPKAEPPDPHKGSVPDPGKGVCADPVGKDAPLGVGGPRPGGPGPQRGPVSVS
jgi:hypothetical protein